MKTLEVTEGNFAKLHSFGLKYTHAVVPRQYPAVSAEISWV